MEWIEVPTPNPSLQTIFYYTNPLRVRSYLVLTATASSRSRIWDSRANSWDCCWKESWKRKVTVENVKNKEKTIRTCRQVQVLVARHMNISVPSQGLCFIHNSHVIEARERLEEVVRQLGDVIVLQVSTWWEERRSRERMMLLRCVINSITQRRRAANQQLTSLTKHQRFRKNPQVVTWCGYCPSSCNEKMRMEVDRHEANQTRVKMVKRGVKKLPHWTP